MDRKETTKYLSQLLVDTLFGFRTYWASEVTFDYATAHPIRVDFMQFEPGNQSVAGIEHGIFKCFEIKSCKEDFRSKNGHNLIGDKNYYVMPEKTFWEVKTEIPWSAGVYTEKDGKLKCIRWAHQVQRKRPLAEMLFMMLRSGMDISYICDKCKRRQQEGRNATDIEEDMDPYEIPPYPDDREESI